ncbi:head-tail joining protein [Skermanella stibiiresistens]|nr:hypothetical protein [Skermanella stibiiresistens]
MIDWDDILHRPAFEELGLSALYRVGDQGDGIPVRLRRDAADQVVPFSGARIVTEASVYLARVMELSAAGVTPAAGDTITLLDGAGQPLETREVQGEPRREDSRRLLWTLDTVAVSGDAP